MKVKKVEITFTAYGLTDYEALENLLFDINGFERSDPYDLNIELVNITEVDAEEEGIAELFEDDE